MKLDSFPIISYHVFVPTNLFQNIFARNAKKRKYSCSSHVIYYIAPIHEKCFNWYKKLAWCYAINWKFLHEKSLSFRFEPVLYVFLRVFTFIFSFVWFCLLLSWSKQIGKKSLVVTCNCIVYIKCTRIAHWWKVFGNNKWSCWCLLWTQ